MHHVRHMPGHSHNVIKRRGSTLAEVTVSAVLLSTMISILGTIVVKTTRVWKETKHVQLGMDELSNQLDWLTTLKADQLQQTLDDLEPSPQIQSIIPDASLAGEIRDDIDGKRIVLSLDWDRGVPAKPLQLTGWVIPSKSTEETKE